MSLDSCQAVLKMCHVSASCWVWLQLMDSKTGGHFGMAIPVDIVGVRWTECHIILKVFLGSPHVVRNTSARTQHGELMEP